MSETALDDGCLAGEAELAETGERTLVRNAAELAAFVQSHRGPPGARAGGENEQ